MNTMHSVDVLFQLMHLKSLALMLCHVRVYVYLFCTTETIYSFLLKK
jgi:hypothetical protein